MAEKLIHQVVFTFTEDVGDDLLEDLGMNSVGDYIDSVQNDTFPLEHVEDLMSRVADWDAQISVEIVETHGENYEYDDEEDDEYSYDLG